MPPFNASGLPHLVKRYPKLVDPLMATLLESMEKFYDELQEMEPEPGDGEAEELEQGLGRMLTWSSQAVNG